MNNAVLEFNTKEEEIHNLDLLATTIVWHGVDNMATTLSVLFVMLELPKMREALKQVRVYDIGAEAFQAGLYEKYARLILMPI